MQGLKEVQTLNNARKDGFSVNVATLQSTGSVENF